MTEDKTLYALAAENNRMLRNLSEQFAPTTASPKSSISDDHEAHLRAAMAIPEHPIHRDVEAMRGRYANAPSINTPEKMAHVLRTGGLPPRPSFIECSACRTQPGLCTECLERRALFAQRDETARCLWSMLRVEKPQDPSLEAALSQMQTHLAGGGLAGSTIALIEHKVRDAALEEAAMSAQTARHSEIVDQSFQRYEKACRDIASRIRAMKSKPAPEACDDKWCSREKRHEGFCKLPPEPVHDFEWALARIREGKKVRRAEWIGPPVDLDGMSWSSIQCKHLLATDWQVAE